MNSPLNREKNILSQFHYDAIDTMYICNFTNCLRISDTFYNLNYDVSLSFTPKTELVKKLLDLRKKYVENGGSLLNLEEIYNEVENRRGGLHNGQENFS